MKALLTAIKTKVNATSALSSLSGKLYAGEVADKATRPYGVVSVVPKSVLTTSYGQPLLMELYPVQFSVWGNGLISATDLVDAIITAFAEVTLTLDSGQLLRTRFTGRGFLPEGKDATGTQTFQAFCTFEFHVQN